MVAGKPKWKSWFTRQNDGIMSRLRARLTLTTKRSIRGNKMTTSTSGKRKQKKGSAPTGDSQPAAGGELHQIAGGEHPALTTNQGLAISDNQNSLRSNPRGPALLEDFILREKITHFDHERIPERIVHARATGAHGFFE